MNFGKALKKVMSQKNLTPTVLVGLTGKSKQHVNYLMNTKAVSIKTMIEMADALNMDYGTFLDYVLNEE